MGIFDRQLEYIEKIESVVYATLKDSINSFDYVIKDYIVNKQLFRKGVDGNNKRLEGYTRTTIKIKISKGQPVDRTTLHDQERFAASITVDAFSDRFEVSSDVGYDKYLIKRYGKNILKPSNENMKDFFDAYFLPSLKKEINKQKE